MTLTDVFLQLQDDDTGPDTPFEMVETSPSQLDSSSDDGLVIS